jgi:hypothetical protein
MVSKERCQEVLLVPPINYKGCWSADHQTEAAGRLTWVKADEMVPLGPEWRVLLEAE